jgi:hypothetical protein
MKRRKMRAILRGKGPLTTGSRDFLRLMVLWHILLAQSVLGGQKTVARQQRRELVMYLMRFGLLLFMRPLVPFHSPGVLGPAD